MLRFAFSGLKAGDSMIRLSILSTSKLMIALTFVMLVGVSHSYARDLVPAEEREMPYRGYMPTCEDQAVLSRLTKRFASRETSYWDSDLSFVGFEKVRELALRPHGADFIPRRFCSALGQFSDGHKRAVDYVIGEDLGITGSGLFAPNWGIAWCVHGLDRNMAYAPECRMARP
jgi:hypothetical protein